MESINNEKWRVRLAIVAIFLLGFVAGGLAVNLYRQGKGSGPLAKGTGPQHRGGGFEAMFKNLNLSDQQKQQVDQILSDTRQRLQEIHRASQPQMDDIKKQTRERLKTVLTEDQWNQFQQQIKEREAHQDRTQDRPHRRPFFQDAEESPSPQQ
jgi:Spy/CpxP family protein refolding chaperone